MTTDQMEMVSLEQLVSAEHVYRKFMQLLDFTSIAHTLTEAQDDSLTAIRRLAILAIGCTAIFHL